MRVKKRFIVKAKKFFKRGEPGFAMIIVLVALLMISVLGATSLLLMVSSMQSIVNMKPEQRAFRVAETGLNVGHALIAKNEVQAEISESGSALGGDFQVTVAPKADSTTDYVLTSIGSCVVDGTTYSRKLKESVYYSGEQAYDAMRNYMCFAGRNLNAYMPGQKNNYPIILNGNMRAENNLNLITYCERSVWDYVKINGDLEARNAVYIEAGGTYYYTGQPDFGMNPNPLDSPGMNVLIYGDIKAGSVEDLSTAGSVTLYAWSGIAAESGGRYVYVRDGSTSGRTSIFAASNGMGTNYEIHTTTNNNLYESMPDPPNHDHIYTGTHKTDRSVQKVYVPQPSFEYYKAMAMEQDTPEEPHFFNVGAGETATLPHDIKKTGISSMSVFYSTGDLELVESVWQDQETNGIFVCEGTFTGRGDYELKEDCKFQVIAGGDVNMTKDTNNRSLEGIVNNYFFYAKRDVNMCLTHFDQNNLQATALRDVNLTCDDEFSYAEFNYRPPQLDVSAWPIDIIVTDWKELPVD